MDNLNDLNIIKYTKINFSNSQKVGIFINKWENISNSKILNKFNFIKNNNFDFYYISNSEFDIIKEDCIAEHILLDLIIFYEDFSNYEIADLIISKAKLFGIPIVLIVENNSKINNFGAEQYKIIRLISENSNLIISSNLVLKNKFSKFCNNIQSLDNEINITETLLNLLIINKRDKESKLYNLFKTFILDNDNDIHFNEYIKSKSHEIILKSGLFEIKWYLSQYPDISESKFKPIRHYINLGVNEGCNPSPNFNTVEYMNDNPNITINPLVHHILYGNSNNSVKFTDAEKDTLNEYISFNSKIKIFEFLDYAKKNANELHFSDFEDFLAKSYIFPIIPAPFNFTQKRCFAFMDHIGKYLRNKLNNSNFNPLVSVILPVFNGIELIQKAIDSVLAQSYDNIELIIIDDGSYDGTAEFLSSLKNEKIVVIKNNHNKGVSNARNQGLNKSTGDYITYLDVDNLWDSKYIETIVGAFFELPDADALYSGQLLYNNYGEDPIGVRFGTYNKSLLENTSYIDLNAFCHRRNVINEISGFDENIYCLEDWDFILKISNNFNIYSVPILLSKYYLNNNKNRLSDNLNIKKIPTFLDYENFDDEIKCGSLNRKVSVIIPSYEVLDDLKECINSILSIDDDFIKIIVVDNNSNIEVKSYLKSLEKNDKIKLILNDINFGFTYAANQGIELADIDSDILFLNNDAVLTKNSIYYMQKYAYSISNCGIIVPQEILVPGTTHNIQIHCPYANPSLNCDATPSLVHSNIVNVSAFHNGEILELSFAPFFCTYVKREMINGSLGLDAELGRHYRSDRIFSNYLKFILNQKIYHVSKIKVFHKSKKATTMLKKNKDSFDYIFKKNQWEPDLARKLGFKNALWDI